jgi:Patatin-like phospholipase
MPAIQASGDVSVGNLPQIRPGKPGIQKARIGLEKTVNLHRFRQRVTDTLIPGKEPRPCNHARHRSFQVRRRKPLERPGSHFPGGHTETHSRGQMGGTVKPQLFITDEGRINMLRSAPPLETLVFRGGGARGIGNAPALTELELTASLQNVKHIVGTSAGALTAISRPALPDGDETLRFGQQRRVARGGKVISNQLASNQYLQPHVDHSVEVWRQMDCCDSAKRLKPPFESLSSHRLRDFVSSWSNPTARR